jgi:hypothetical protein
MGHAFPDTIDGLTSLPLIHSLEIMDQLSLGTRQTGIWLLDLLIDQFR